MTDVNCTLSVSQGEEGSRGENGVQGGGWREPRAVWGLGGVGKLK